MFVIKICEKKKKNQTSVLPYFITVVTVSVLPYFVTVVTVSLGTHYLVSSWIGTENVLKLKFILTNYWKCKEAVVAVFHRDWFFLFYP